ncbi:hypothetical protein DM02DRAFT_664105 [Periconia macrospinosa]|uniref:Uncharacterized protein n=1 Tax=Periconia macrospinosa TaxID=97972 RepID=A0A2V1D006_9PLEO|nr:hypothetical protein DM02DRAFT_664105 [Periconia macrospinosa]
MYKTLNLIVTALVGVCASALTLLAPVLHFYYGRLLTDTATSSSVIAGRAPLAPIYQYYHGSTLIKTNVSSPVTFNGLAIGTTELNPNAVNGTLHNISDGHHFYHQDWRLSKRQSFEAHFFEGASDFSVHGSEFNNVGGDQIINNGVINIVPESSSASWQFEHDSNPILDFFEGDSFVTSSIDIIGSIAGLALDAFEIF